MKVWKLLIAGFIGIIIGAGAMAPVAYYQHQQKSEAVFYLDALIQFIDNMPECKAAFERS